MAQFDISLMTRSELEDLLKGNTNPVEANRIIAGYEIGENVFSGINFHDGNPYFYHLTRVARILLAELNIYEPDLIIASLLHDYSRVENVISKDILELNFGPYLLYLVELLSMSIEETAQIPDEIALPNNESLKIPIDDYLLIKLAEQVDLLRSLSFDLSFSPVAYLCELNKQLLPIASKSRHNGVQYLLKELSILKNKIVG